MLVNNMASEAEDPTSGGNSPLSETPEANDALTRLTRDFEELSEKAQQLLTEKLYLENEYAQLKKRTNRLDEELRNIKNPPLVIGYIQDMVGDQAVVRSSNGTVFLVSVNQRLANDELNPGTRVALNQDTLSVVEILSDSWDPLISSAEIIENTIDEIKQLKIPFGFKANLWKTEEPVPVHHFASPGQKIAANPVFLNFRSRFK